MEDRLQRDEAMARAAAAPTESSKRTIYNYNALNFDRQKRP